VYIAKSEPAKWRRGEGRAALNRRDQISGETNRRDTAGNLSFLAQNRDHFAPALPARRVARDDKRIFEMASVVGGSNGIQAYMPSESCEIP
jgi:hypothetical protein